VAVGRQQLSKQHADAFRIVRDEHTTPSLYGGVGRDFDQQASLRTYEARPPGRTAIGMR
jgi:hypothetical protein